MLNDRPSTIDVGGTQIDIFLQHANNTSNASAGAGKVREMGETGGGEAFPCANK